ncbi:28S ribosomal protein S24, mitochondrial [Copidosoma floridanum]|uniref:28S ribosomal protein S24, mitochondrial n=1 Tax=Copidosoma floridanum TaxID=29053 RepID=UPI0006C9BC93|nr:28S ribosomal protein S24, mitochondrial [Copidosoma floridanum]
MAVLTSLNILQAMQNFVVKRSFHISSAVNKSKAGRYKITLKKNKPLTYEMANPPHHVAHRKSWNSWNTSNIVDGNRPMESTIEDMFIRRFMTGTWHNLFLSEIIIKRNHNMVRIAGLIRRQFDQKKMYFLTGYTEELLSYYLHCPVKLELQSVEKKENVIYKYI